MREGNEEQIRIRRLFGIAAHTAHADDGAPLPGTEVTSAEVSQTPSTFVRVPKTLLSDMRVYSTITKHPLSLNDAFIGDKKPVDVMLDKQQRALSNENVLVQYHYPQQRTLVVSTHAMQNTFEVKVRPFKREEDRVRIITPEEEKALLEEVELPYRKMPGVEVSWTKEALHVGERIQENAVLLVSLDKSPDARRAKEVLLNAMQAKGRSIS